MVYRLTVQKGFQTKAYNTKADIAVLGGAAGGGKSYSIILEISKHINNPKFSCGIYRKSKNNFFCSKGLWETVLDFARLSGIKTQASREKGIIKFASGAKCHFCHTNSLNFLNDTKGAQYTAVFFDEADALTAEDYRLVCSRLRSDCEIKPYARIVTNPCSGWLRDLVAKFLTDDYYPDEEQVEKIKYLYYINEKPVVLDSPKEFIREYGFNNEQLNLLQTITFIPGKIDENKKLLNKNPNYFAYLNGLPHHLRERLLHGCWSDTPKTGMFHGKNFKDYVNLPRTPDGSVIFVDTAVKTSKENDFTVATCWTYKKENLYLTDMLRGKWGYTMMKERVIAFIEENDYVDTVYIEDIQSGSVLLDDLKNNEKITEVRIRPIVRPARISKLKRAEQALAHLSHVKVYLPAMEERIKKLFLNEVLSFSAEMDHKNDDIADTFFDAINHVGKICRRGNFEQKTESATYAQAFEKKRIFR